MPSQKLRIKLRPMHTPPDIARKVLCGELAVIAEPVSLLGDVDASEGVIKGVRVADRVVALPYSVGSTVGSYLIYALRKSGNAPRAFVVTKVDSVLAVGAVISDIPLYTFVDSLMNVKDLLRLLKRYEGTEVCIDGRSNEMLIRGRDS